MSQPIQCLCPDVIARTTHTTNSLDTGWMPHLEPLFLMLLKLNKNGYCYHPSPEWILCSTIFFNMTSFWSKIGGRYIILMEPRYVSMSEIKRGLVIKHLIFLAFLVKGRHWLTNWRVCQMQEKVQMLKANKWQMFTTHNNPTDGI